MATSFLPFSLTFLLLCYVSVAQIGFGRDYGLSPWRGSPRLGAQNRCSFERLSAHNASRRVESEAGVTEYFDETNEQFQCAGIAAFRRTIQPGGILLPAYSNFHQLAYIEQGRGLTGVVIPGCPATFQQQHQKIRRFETGDILVLPAGLAHFCYNDGESPVVVVVVEDTSNSANQLDRKRRHFQLAGTQPREEGQQQEDSSDGNMISGFDAELLAESFGISVELVRKLQKTEEKKGEIVKAEGELKMVALPIEEEIEEGRRVMNGLEQAFCAVKLTENIDRPSLADIYNPRGGRITNVNVLKLPILSFIQMSASRGVLFKDAMLAPHWYINAHSAVYVTKGRAQIQIVGDRGKRVFDGELQQGQLLIVPQNFVLIKQARSETFEWVAFRTHGNAIANQIVGSESLFAGLPEDVIYNSYSGISRGEARILKRSRIEDVAIVAPPQSQEGRVDA